SSGCPLYAASMTKDWPSWLTKSTLTPCLMYSIRVRSPWRAKSKSLVANSASSCSLFSSVMQVSLSCELRNFFNGCLDCIVGAITPQAFHLSVEVRNHNGCLADIFSRPPTRDRRGLFCHIRMQPRLLGKGEFIAACGIEPCDDAYFIGQCRRDAHGFCAQLQCSTAGGHGLSSPTGDCGIRDVPVFYFRNPCVVALHGLPRDITAGIGHKLGNGRG